MDEFSPAEVTPLESRPPAQPASHEPLVARSDVRVAEHAPADRSESLRIKLAWTKLLWLLLFLAVLLAVSYTVPYVIEETQYAAQRGRRRADHELAKAELQGLPLGDLSRAGQLVTQAVSPSVVHISARNGTSDMMPSMMGMRSSPFHVPPPGQGSGVIVDGARGYVITNYHVIAGASEIKVRLAEGKYLGAELVDQDPDTDIAVLKIRREEMPNRPLIAAEWGDSESLEVGSLVWALGSPYGLEQSVTSGIISAKHRADKVGNPLQDFLQTDAAVNPGNSGGPLVDIQGRIVGINTAIVGENFQGISFAVPSQVARKVYEQIISDSEHLVRRGYLGIMPAEMNDERARAAGLDTTRGVYVVQVMAQSPAASLPLQAGDIILSWNGTPVENPAQLTQVICETPIGSQATIVIWRQGSDEELSLSVTVGERPRNAATEGSRFMPRGR